MLIHLVQWLMHRGDKAVSRKKAVYCTATGLTTRSYQPWCHRDVAVWTPCPTALLSEFWAIVPNWSKLKKHSGEGSRNEFVPRRSSTLENLIELPWQIAAILALFCYPGVLLLSWYLSSKPILEATASAPLRLWPWAAGLLGFAVLMSFIKGLQKKNLFR